MNVLLRHAVTGHYFAGPESWVPDPGKAIDFKAAEVALKESQDCRLEGVELVFRYGNPVSEMAVAISKHLG